MSDSGDPQTFAEDTVLLDLWLTGNMIWASNAQELYEPVCVYVYAREREWESERKKGRGRGGIRASFLQGGPVGTKS